MAEEMVKEYKRAWGLMRRFDSSQTLIFYVVMNIDEDEENRGSFAATIDKLEGTVVAVEDSPLAAEESALRLFREMVDHCIEKGTLKELIGDAPIMRKVNLPFDAFVEVINKAIAKIEALRQDPLSSHEDDEESYTPASSWFLEKRGEQVVSA